MELLWCNGHVVMQSQTNRKLPPRPEKTAPCVPAPAPAPAPAAAATAPEDEAGLWLPFAVPDSLDIFSDLFCEAPAAAAVKPPCERGVVVPPPEDDDRHGAVVSEAPPCGLMPLPKSTTPRVPWSRQQTVSLGDGDDLSELARAGNKAAGHQASSSTMLSAIGSSICGSNQVMVPRRAPDTALPSAVGSANASGRGSGHEAATVQASSSGRSNGCFGATTEPTSISNRSSKRKRLDSEDSESPSESESPAAAAARKPRTKMATARRSRAAEVHNVSERVRALLGCHFLPSLTSLPR
jgi:phytochrome-interacting factor 4